VDYPPSINFAVSNVDYVTATDVNGDGRTDLVGFRLDGVYVTLSTTRLWLSASGLHPSINFMAGTIRLSPQQRISTAIAGHLVGFGLDGVYVALSTGNVWF
jgi:hypothetical protein